MAKVRQGRGKQGSPSRDNRGSSRSQSDKKRQGNNQNREGQERNRNFDDRNRGFGNREDQDRNRNFDNQNQGFRNREDQDRNRNFDDQNRGYRNREDQDRNRNFDNQNQGFRNREDQDRNRNFDDQNRGYRNREDDEHNRGNYNRDDQDRHRKFEDQNRGPRNRAPQERNRNFDEESRGQSRERSFQNRNRSDSQNRGRQAPERDFDNRNRPRSNPSEDQRQSNSETDESSTSGEQDLLVFGRNTVISYLERMCLDEENNEQTQQIIKIFLADGSAPDERIRKINSLAKHLKIPVVACHPNKLDWMVQEGGRHQGVAAQVSPIVLLEFSEWLGKFQVEKERRAAEGKGLDGYVVVALDGIEDPRNVGAIIRSAEAQGAHVILIPERRAAQVTETVAKTSAGAVVHIPIVRVVNLVKAIEELKEQGFWVLGLTADAPQPLYKVDLKRPLVIIVGSEGKGMRPLVRSNCDLFGAIPLNGKTESLNASVALGIAVYETVKQNSSN